MDYEQQNDRAATLGLALLPIVLTLRVPRIQLFYFKDFTPHIPLAFACGMSPVIDIAYA
jgi:NhaC family Na+:H+ antiporter